MARRSLHIGGDRGTHEEPIVEKLEEEVFNPDAAKVDDNPFPEELIEEQDYNSMTVEELKTLCRERGLAVSGNKAELIARLEAHDDTPAEAAVEESVEEDTPAEAAVSEDKPMEGEVSESGGNE